MLHDGSYRVKTGPYPGGRFTPRVPDHTTVAFYESPVTAIVVLAFALVWYRPSRTGGGTRRVVSAARLGSVFRHQVRLSGNLCKKQWSIA